MEVRHSGGTRSCSSAHSRHRLASIGHVAHVDVSQQLLEADQDVCRERVRSLPMIDIFNVKH